MLTVTVSVILIASISLLFLITPIYGMAGANIVPCNQMPEGGNPTFPPPIFASIEWNKYSYGMVCGLQSIDPLDSLFVGYIGQVFSMNTSYATRDLVSTVSSGFNTNGMWKSPWAVQDGISFYPGGFDVACYSSSKTMNLSAFVYSALCSEDGPCGCVASYPLEVTSHTTKVTMTVTQKV